MTKKYQIVWPDNKSEVRVVGTGNTIRLVSPYGTFSRYDPNRPYTGFAWDAHTAATLLVNGKPKNVLILGLGGGTIARQIRLMSASTNIVGVEIDSSILSSARQQFRLDDWSVDVVNTASEEFLKNTRRSFDVILDDMWPIVAHEQRPILSHKKWCRLIRRHLALQGVYSVTAFRRTEDPSDIPKILQRLHSNFEHLCEIRPHDGQTTVIAASDTPLLGASAHARRRRLPSTIARGLGHVRYIRISMEQPQCTE